MSEEPDRTGGAGNATFRTPTGFCAITPTHIAVNPGVDGGDVFDALLTRPNRGTLQLYAAIGVLCILYPLALFLLPSINPLRHDRLLTLLMGMSLASAGILLILFVLRRRATALPIVIARRTIAAVIPHPPADGHGGWFEVRHEIDGRFRTHRIEPLVGGWSDAAAIMEEAGVIESTPPSSE